MTGFSFKICFLYCLILLSKFSMQQKLPTVTEIFNFLFSIEFLKGKQRHNSNFKKHACWSVSLSFLIYLADPQLRKVVIIVFTCVVRTSVTTFQNLAKQNKFQAKTMFTTGETVGLAEWIIDDTCQSMSLSLEQICKIQRYAKIYMTLK